MHAGGAATFLSVETMFEVEVLRLVSKEMAMYKDTGVQNIVLCSADFKCYGVVKCNMLHYMSGRKLKFEMNSHLINIC